MTHSGGTNESGTSWSGSTSSCTHVGGVLSFFDLLRSDTCDCIALSSVVSNAFRWVKSEKGGSGGSPGGASLFRGGWNLNSIVSRAVLYLDDDNSWSLLYTF